MLSRLSDALRSRPRLFGGIAAGVAVVAALVFVLTGSSSTGAGPAGPGAPTTVTTLHVVAPLSATTTLRDLAFTLATDLDRLPGTTLVRSTVTRVVASYVSSGRVSVVRDTPTAVIVGYRSSPSSSLSCMGIRRGPGGQWTGGVAVACP